MPYRDKEKQKAWYQQNKARLVKKNTQYSSDYRKTETGKKNCKINSWKRQGILCFDYELLYDLFLSTKKCEYCDVILTTDKKPTKTTKCLDHDHDVNDKFNVRGVLCNSCNRKDVFKKK
tara:strand:+ start:717 stop:1073 length:357 start_codon:yes stop_codon:yes gene_type:complete